MQQIMSQIRAAVDSYQLIQPGDRIAVGISGGKDSLILLCALANMRKFLPMKYDLVAITVDPCFNNIQTNFSQVEELCRRLQVTYEIRRSQLGNIIFEQRKESNPCSLCAVSYTHLDVYKRQDFLPDWLNVLFPPLLYYLF